MNLESLQQVAKVLEDEGASGLYTVEDLVDALVNIGLNDKVAAFHDDILGLKSHLSEEFLKTPLDSVDEEKFEPQIALVLDEANTILYLWKRELSDEDWEERREYRRRMGLDDD